MKTTQIVLTSIFFLLALSLAVFSQGAARTDEWRGLKLGVSSPADAIDLFGNPAKDRLNQKFRSMAFDDLFDPGAREFRVFIYEEARALRGFKSASLYFRDDVLMVIRLKPKSLKASALERAYDSEFEFVPDPFSDVVIPGDRRRGRYRYPRNYPMFYYLLNETDQAYAIAAIDNNSVREVFGDRRRIPDKVPGNVNTLDLISTQLVSEDGADLLK